MKNLERLLAGMLGMITQTKLFYLVYSGSGTFLGKVPITPASRTAFEKGDWDFFSEAFKLKNQG